MHQTGSLSMTPWRHEHAFGLHRKRKAASRTRQVAIITAASPSGVHPCRATRSLC